MEDMSAAGWVDSSTTVSPSCVQVEAGEPGVQSPGGHGLHAQGGQAGRATGRQQPRVR